MKKKTIVITDELLKKELTPEQYDHYMHVYNTEGIQAAIETLPNLGGETAWVTACNSRIKQLRIEHGLTQNDLANYLNVTQKEYWRYEQDGYSVNIFTLAQIAMFYNISIDWFSGLHPVRKPFFDDELLSEIYGTDPTPLDSLKASKKKK